MPGSQEIVFTASFAYVNESQFRAISPPQTRKVRQMSLEALYIRI